ncbi:MAG: response regulator [bacterium]
MGSILIVDDEQRFRDVYKILLGKEGYTIFDVSNAVNARDILKNEKIDVVLLDINMPELQGDILYDIIQSFHKNMRVIVTSVLPIDEQITKIPGAYDYFDKSDGLDLLLAKVKRAIPPEPSHAV